MTDEQRKHYLAVTRPWLRQTEVQCVQYLVAILGDPREVTDANADAIFRELYGDGQPVRLTGQEALDAIRGAD